MFEHHCCSRTKFRMGSGRGKNPSPMSFSSSKKPVSDKVNGTPITTSFMLLAGALISLIPFLNENDVEFAKLAFLDVDIIFQLSFSIYHCTVTNHT